MFSNNQCVLHGFQKINQYQYSDIFSGLLGTVALILSTFAYAAEPCDTVVPPQVLTKEVALNRLLQCNFDVLDSKRAIIANESGLTIAGETPNPNLTIGIGGINPKLGIGSGSYFDKTIDNSIRYEQLIERGNKRELRVKSAQQQVNAAKQDVQDIERQQSIALLKAMVDLAATNERIKLLTQVVDLYQETLRANTIRTQHGDLPPIDAQRQKIDANHAQMDLRQAKADAKSAQIALATLLAWQAKVEDIAVDTSILDTTITDNSFDVANRADVKAAEMRVEAAKNQLDLAQAQVKSDVTAGVQYDHWPASASNPTGTGDTISFTVGIPLNIHHRYEGEIAKAANDYDAAKDALQRVKANAQIEMERNNADFDNARMTLDLLEKEQLPRTEEVARTVELGYKKGALDLLDLLDARRVLRQTQLDTLNARANLARITLTRNLFNSN